MTKNINLIYIPMQKLKTTTIGVYMHRPLNAADVSKNAVLPYVLRQGCRLCENSEQISKYLENLYGAVLSAGVAEFGDDQVLRFEAETISDKYAAEGETLTADALRLILSVMFEPVTEDGGFKKSVIAVEKSNAKDRIMSVMNDKRSYAMQRCVEEMCAGENYALSRYGTVEGVEEITAESLYEYYKKAVTSSVIDIYVCGDANEGELRSIVEEVTADIKFASADIPKTELHKNSGIKNVTDRMDVNQGKLSVGFTTDTKPEDGDYFALMVMNSVFGAGAHSKLFNNVREKLSLAYYASSNIVKSKGLLIVNAGIEFQNFQKAYDEILLQLKAIQNGEISEEEFNSSVNALINIFESYNDDAALTHGFYTAERVYGTNYSLDYVKEKIKAVTVDEVAAAARKVKLDTVYFLTGKGDN
ncbi:MAG: insulinase family protein [Firmicutes bacterium]|nr:insulinase family protein [Bacillota bacterium]